MLRNMALLLFLAILVLMVLAPTVARADMCAGCTPRTYVVHAASTTGSGPFSTGGSSPF